MKNLIEELARLIKNLKIAKAIRECIKRDKEFIPNYIKGNFTLEAESTAPNISEKKRKVGKAEDEHEVEIEGELAPVMVDGHEAEWWKSDNSDENQRAEEVVPAVGDDRVDGRALRFGRLRRRSAGR